MKISLSEDPSLYPIDIETDYIPCEGDKIMLGNDNKIYEVVEVIIDLRKPNAVYRASIQLIG